MNSELLRKTASAIRELDRENKELKSENETLRKTAEAQGFAASLIRDGELDPDDFDSKVSELVEGDLEAVKTAMAMAKKGSALGTVEDTPDLPEGNSDPLTEYLLGLAR